MSLPSHLLRDGEQRGPSGSVHYSVVQVGQALCVVSRSLAKDQLFSLEDCLTRSGALGLRPLSA